MDHFNKLQFELNKELSTEGFQEKLYQWLEEQGILPELRTYLRHQLISALKHTHLSSEYLNRKKNHLSPKIHAINLLVVEYLLEQNYHYTVSIFYSEEPHMGRLPTHIKLPPEEVLLMKFFKEKDVEDILVSLNLGHSPKFVKKVVDIYLGEKKGLASNSLLEAIFQVFVVRGDSPMSIKQELSAGDAYTSEDTPIKRRSEMTNKSVISKTDQVPHQMQENNHHHKNSIGQQEGKLIDMEWKQREFERRVQDEVKKLQEELENKMSIHRKSLEGDLMEKQQQLLELMNLLKEQQVQLQLHFKDIQEKENMLNQKETKLEENQQLESAKLMEKYNEIIKSQQKLEEDFKRLNQEKNTVRFLQKEMEASHSQILEVAQLLGNSQQELDLLQSLHLERQTKNERNGMHQSQQDGKHNFSVTDPFHLVQSVRTLQEHAIQACRSSICQLKDKNTKLQMIADEQRSKINTLSSTASTLNSQLEEATAALRFLSSQDDKSNLYHGHASQEHRITFPVARLEVATQQKEQRQNEVFAKDKIHKNKHLGQKTQKQHPKDQIFTGYKQESDESASSIMSSPTEEILREARHRLQRLEIESDEVDKRYYKFKQKHLSKGIGISTLHLSQTIPLNTQTLDREKILPSSSVALTAYAPQYECYPTPHKPQQTNASLPFENGLGHFSLVHREETEPIVNQLTVYTQPSNNSNPSQPVRNASSNLSSTLRKLQQDPKFSGGPTGNDMDVTVVNNNINPGVLLSENSGPVASVEVDQNTFILHRASQPAEQARFGDMELETSPSHNAQSIKQLPSLNAISQDEIRNGNHFLEVSQNKDGRYSHSTEKNHLSAFNVIPIFNSQIHPLEDEKAGKTNLKNEKGDARCVQPAVHLLNNKVGDKNNVKSPSELSKARQVYQEEASEAMGSVSSSSQKLSVGANDSKAGEDSDFW